MKYSTFYNSFCNKEQEVYDRFVLLIKEEFLSSIYNIGIFINNNNHSFIHAELNKIIDNLSYLNDNNHITIYLSFFVNLLKNNDYKNITYTRFMNYILIHDIYNNI